MTQPHEDASAPLHGVRVLDLSRLLPGPFASLLMADMGADVIKVEDPRGGDYLRWLPPQQEGTSLLFSALNRGKRSVALDLKSDRGREAFLALSEHADVVLESFRPGVMDRLGCGWNVLKERNPNLIYCALTGYGQEGPYARRAGHDINYLALAGLLGQNARGEDRPVIPGFQVADVAGGAYNAANQIVAALLARERSGGGAFLDVSIVRGAASVLMMTTVEALASSTPVPGTGTLSGGRACYNVYRTADDRFMALGALEPKFWQGFCTAVERPDWVSRQFEVGEAGEALKDEVQDLFEMKTRGEWEAFFSDLDVCCEPVLSLEESTDHVAMTGPMPYRFELSTEVGQTTIQLATPGQPPAFVSKLRPAPPLGADTAEALQEVGWSEERIARLSEPG